MNYQERVSTIADVKALYEKVIEQPNIRQYRGYTEQRSYGYDPESGEILNQKGEFWFDNPEYDPLFEPPVEDDEMQSLEQVNHGRWTAKHPHFNALRGMLCPTCDKALWDQIEIKGIFFKKKITIKDQPNFCKFCGQKLKAAY